MANKNKKYSKEQIEQMIIAECKKWGVPPALALGIAKHESGLIADNLSPVNSDGSRDQGVFQLNNKYFKMKNWADPKENISRGVQHIAALQKTFGNDVKRILMAYNAGAGAVQSGKVPLKTKNEYVPRALKQIQSYQTTLSKNNGTLNRTVKSMENIATGGSDNNMATNGNYVTGAAAEVQLPPEIQAQLNPTTLSAENLNTLLTNARKGDTEARQAYEEMMNTRLSSYDTPSIIIGQDKDGKDIKISPREYDELKRQQIQSNLAEQRRQAIQAVNPYTEEAQAYSQGVYDRLNNLYNQQIAAIQAANPTGYKGADPDYLRWSLQTAGGAGIAAGAQKSPEALATAFAQNAKYAQEADRIAYEQQVANQMGIPYNQYVAMKNAEAAATQNMLNETGKVSQQDMTRLGTSATAAGNIYKSDTDLATEQIKQIESARQFDAELIQKYGTDYANLIKQEMMNNGTYFDAVMGYQQAMDTAKTNRSSNIAGNIVAGQYGLGRQSMINAGNMVTQQMENEGKYNTQLLKGSQDFATEKYKTENPINVISKLTQAEVNDAIANYNNPNSRNQFFGGLPTNLVGKYFPNYFTVNTGSGTGTAPAQSPVSKQNLLELWGLGNSK